MYEKALIKAGLTEKQAKVYLACLELGKTKPSEVAKKAGIKRTTAYGLIDELVNLGLISYSQKGNTKQLKAQDPNSIIELLENRKKEVESVLPELESLYGTYHIRPKIQFYEGQEGIKRIYEDTLKCQSKKICQIVRVKDFLAFPGGDFARDYIQRRAAKGITAYALHPKSDDIHDQTYGQPSEQWKRQVRYLPPSMFYASMIMLYDNKVAMISTKAENFGFIIESKEFSHTLQAYFDFMWQVGSKEPES